MEPSPDRDPGSRVGSHIQRQQFVQSRMQFATECANADRWDASTSESKWFGASVKRDKAGGGG